MSVDATAGAMPRVGLPPDRYNNALTAPGAKCNGLNHSLSRGELLPTTSSDAVVATIAKWFGTGVANFQVADLTTGPKSIFPTLAVAHPGGFDMGFMG